MSYPQTYQQQPGYGTTSGYPAPPAGAYPPPPPGQYPQGQYPAGQYPPPGPVYQQPATVYVYDDRGRRQAEADKEIAEDCCLLACCCAVLCCCFANS
ncbi:galectin-3-like [Ylistrum balloti]|uniref:galectin-3-like n=1 Tax=Ylistrum balloti TaxID=509963 RepID=UPI002905E3DD|nr:galectin-3-like [Ylistrum balloti]